MVSTKECEFCGKSFEIKGKKAQNKKFCNPNCYTSSKIRYKKINCLSCNVEMTITLKMIGFTKFCSDNCVHDYNSKNKKKYKKSMCINCSKDYWRHDTKNATIFCSGNCKKEYNYSQNKTTKKCLECNNEYEIHKNRYRGSKFCSVSCSSKYNSKKQGLGTKIKPETSWNKGLNKNDERIARSVEKQKDTWRKNYKQGKINMYFTGKKLSIKHKNNIINGMEQSEKNKQRLENHPIFKSGYKKELGHFVRSSWETNFSKILVYLNREYKYEYKRFILSDGSIYIPDFYDIKRNRWYEVKGQWTIIGFKKYHLFKKDYPNEKITLISPKKYGKLIKHFKNKIDFE